MSYLKVPYKSEKHISELTDYVYDSIQIQGRLAFVNMAQLSDKNCVTDESSSMTFYSPQIP